jgi:uncharacterized Zn finger protein
MPLIMDARVFCYTCGRKEDHEVLSRTRGMRVRCRTCGTVQDIAPEKERPPLMLKAIVSAEGSSRVCSIELSPDETAGIGDRHVAACGDDYVGVEITGIERGPQRVRKARARDITTLWTRKIEQVLVRVSVHNRKSTVPVLLDVSGEEPFVVGEIYRHNSRRFRVAQIKLRDGDSLRVEGQKVIARRIKRIYAYQL